MKTLFKILAILVVIIFSLLFILPMVYKSEIINLTKSELNKNVNATIDFEDIDLSLFKSFPNFNISIYGFNIVGKGEFKNDTLIKIERISMAIDIFSVINSNSYKVKNIKLYNPVANIKVLKDGSPNYDISLTEEVIENKISNENAVTGFYFDIDKFQISNGELNYYDDELNLIVRITGLYHTLSGRLGTDKAVLFTSTKVGNFNVKYHDVTYITNAAVVYKASIDADIKNEIYKLGKNELIVNDLFVNFDGAVSFIDDEPNIILTFKSKGNKFKDILSLVPVIYATNFKSITTEGVFSLEGFIKGTYNENHIPSFNIVASVDNAMFKYPDLPKSVSNININANISNKGGDIDNTIIDIGKLELSLGNNPFSASLKVSTPVSDPNIITSLVGEINLNNIQDFYPLEDDLTGDISFNVKFDGKLSSIENISKGNNNFVAMGSILARNLNYKTSTIRNSINIEVAQLNFSPQYIDLVSFKATVDKSDIQATGKISNYLPYYFNTGVLDGSLILNSNYLNIDGLISESDTDNTLPGDTAISVQQHTDVKSSSIVEIPKNIKFLVSTKFNKLIYDSLEMNNIAGKLIIADKTLQLQNLTMDAVDGKMIVSGSYSIKDIDKPQVDFQVNMKNLSIQKAYNKFAIIRNYLPMAKKTTGLFSADFNLNTILDADMMPVYSTMNGKGTLSTSNIIINDLNTLSQIAESLKLIKFNKLEIDKIHLSFEFVDGKLEVKPAKFKYQNVNAEIEGWTSFDKSIGYTLKLEIPRAEFGGDANKVIDGLLAQINNYGTNFSVSDIIPISIFIDGTLNNPKISTAFTSTNSTVVEKTEGIINKEIEKEKEKLSKEASAKAQKIIKDADNQAKQIIQEAEKQATLINESAAEAKNNLIAETDKQANALIAEGKKNGFVAEMAAKEAAKQLKSEVGNNADNIIAEANKNADNIINEAKKAAKKLKADAKKQAQKIKE